MPNHKTKLTQAGVKYSASKILKKLPAEIIKFLDQETFRKKLKKHLIGKAYHTLQEFCEDLQ